MHESDQVGTRPNIARHPADEPVTRMGPAITTIPGRLVDVSGLKKGGSQWNPLSEGSVTGVAVISP